MKTAKKAYHCTGCQNWPIWSLNIVNEKCCTCCTGPNGERPGQGVTSE